MQTVFIKILCEKYHKLSEILKILMLLKYIIIQAIV